MNFVKRLLIEPVWNRNTQRLTAKGEREEPFNRTSMESKRGIILANHELEQATFNRTSMESKLRAFPTSGSRVTAFNRTSMESKLRIERCATMVGELLIEPVWNRNHGTILQGSIYQ